MDASTLLVDLVGPFVSLLAGLSLAGVGWRVGASSPEGTKRELALSRIPLTSPSALEDGMEVKVRGVVAQGESLVTSPLTGRQGVACVTSAALVEGPDVALEGASRDFWLDCRGGARVRVRTKGAELLGTPEWLLFDLHVAHAAGVRVIGRATPEQRQWALSRLRGETNVSHLVEVLVQPGQELYVVGLVRFDAGVPTLQAVAPGELTIVARSEAHLYEALSLRRSLAFGLAGAGLLVALGSSVWAVWSLLS